MTLLGCNHDIKLMLACGTSQSYYVVKYNTKAQLESSHAPLAAVVTAYSNRLARKQRLPLPDGGTASVTKSRMAGLLMAATSSREICTQLAALYLYRGSCCFSSHEFTYIQMAQLYAFLSGEQLHCKVRRNNTGEFFVAPAVLNWVHRPSDLEAIDLYTFFAEYELVPLPRPPATSRRAILRLLTGHPQHSTHGVSRRALVHVPVVVGPRPRCRALLQLCPDITTEVGSVVRQLAGAGNASIDVDTPAANVQHLEEYARYALTLFDSWRDPADILGEHSTYFDAAAAWAPSRRAAFHMTNVQAFYSSRAHAAAYRQHMTALVIPDSDDVVPRAPLSDEAAAELMEDAAAAELDETLAIMSAGSRGNCFAKADPAVLAAMGDANWIQMCLVNDALHTATSTDASTGSELAQMPPLPTFVVSGEDGASTAGWSATIDASSRSAPSVLPPDSGPAMGPSVSLPRPETIQPFLECIRDRSMPAAGGSRLPMGDAVNGHVASMGRLPTIREASELFCLTPDQHLQFSMAAMLLLRDAQLVADMDIDGVLTAEVSAAIGNGPRYIVSQGLSGTSLSCDIVCPCARPGHGYYPSSLFSTMHPAHHQGPARRTASFACIGSWGGTASSRPCTSPPTSAPRSPSCPLARPHSTASAASVMAAGTTRSVTRTAKPWPR